MFDLKKSPIRKIISTLPEDKMSIFEEDDLTDIEKNPENKGKYRVRYVLKDIENMLTAVKNNKNNSKTRVAVMGELKAGKSTFVNLCAGKEIAYTDVLEATAIVSEITYSDEEYARLIDKNGKIVREFTFEELMNWSMEQQDKQFEDSSCFADYSKLEIGVKSELFRGIVFVDTPGLLSITSENSEVTSKYIAETDYILWILDSTTLGSTAVNEAIKDTKYSGKPMLCIANKVDNPSELAGIKDYVDKEYVGVFEEKFYISALNLWEEYIENPASRDKNTTLTEIFECLEDIADSKEHSVNNTLSMQLNKDKELHEKLLKRVEERKEYYDKEIANFSNINREIKAAIDKELERWIKMDFFTEEKNRLYLASGDSLQTLFREYSSSEYLTALLDKKYKEMDEYIRNKWKWIERGLTMNATQSEVIIDFHYDRDLNLDEENKTQNSTDTELSNVVEGGKTGLKIGLAFAGYVAWLGPAAAQVTFLGSIVPIAIPIVVIGAGIGLFKKTDTKKLMESENNAKKKQQTIDNLYDDVLRAVAEELFKIQDVLKKTSDCYLEKRKDLQSKAVKELHMDFTEPAYSKFIEEMNDYLTGLKYNIDNLQREEIKLPPEKIK